MAKRAAKTSDTQYLNGYWWLLFCLSVSLLLVFVGVLLYPRVVDHFPAEHRLDYFPSICFLLIGSVFAVQYAVLLVKKLVAHNNHGKK